MGRKNRSSNGLSTSRRRQGIRKEWVCIFVFIYEYKTIKPVEIPLRRGEEGECWGCESN
jgi:hypothetical protein